MRRVGARQRTVSAVAGFRGAVSLAAVLAVPHTLDSGAPFPDRDLIVLITCGVIVLTLLQALFLPAVVRFARLPVDTSVAEELQLAESPPSTQRIEALDTTAASSAAANGGRAGAARAGQAAQAARGRRCRGTTRSSSTTTSTRASRLALIGRRREALLELRDEQRIDDIVLRRVQARLDNEEVRLSRTSPVD